MTDCKADLITVSSCLLSVHAPRTSARENCIPSTSYPQGWDSRKNVTEGGGEGGGVPKLKDIIIGSCVQL